MYHTYFGVCRQRLLHPPAGVSAAVVLGHAGHASRAGVRGAGIGGGAEATVTNHTYK